MKISMNGFGENAATLELAGEVTPGMAVKMAANGTAGPCAAGEKLCGVALALRGGYVSVQLAGYAALPFTGTAPAAGWQTLSANGVGGVKTDDAGREYLVVDVDETAKTCGILL